MMKIKILLLSSLLFSSLLLTGKDERIASFPPSKEFASEFKKPDWLQYGFRIGVNVPLHKQFYVNTDFRKLFSAEFGAYVRAGKYVYAELGFGYAFNKSRFIWERDTFETALEFRFLQIPLKIVGVVPMGEIFTLEPGIGIIYQPLIQTNKNLYFSQKENLNKHHFLLTAGLGIKVYFFTLDIHYRYGFTPYLKKSAIKKPAFIHIALGFQF